ncbi:conserved hypothetical protein; putative exported protein [Xenorhabdus bovienii str. Jollieti]|uniref:UPF0482 protein XBJ1_2325 n=1 Tax=Xenorhabdus bovienii (strain SS-2004) TaxID=406818 RepID=D3V1A7_XENBS|nr:DUF1283 family protein [Xenorhabdus bovienii]CBJ81451.1 conserved hypothetical protein; putative exported protein [Xenorhabdus bovienii SS-2004]CDH27233.1 conserved hypothetical protein; putative exported protein [Xenorhabdus bovienii str. Jollieti]
MNVHNSLIAKTVSAVALLLPLLWQTPAFSAPCTSSSTCVTINGGGENSMSKEMARQQKEEWNEQGSLRKKINKREEKQFDKYEVDVDNRDACLKSTNVNAYWEPNTKRCLDLNTGLPIKP